MRLDLNILNHLGLNLYSNTPAVLSEVIANSWDADASVVKITCNQEDDLITIVDNGNGMDLNDINDKFLCVGYRKRDNGENISPKYRRRVMGRKGIGKLSLLSIADNIEIYSKKDDSRNAFCMARADIEREINETNSTYSPREIPFVDFDFATGTKIEIRGFKKNINRTPEFLRKRLARRFSVMGTDFQISINDVPVTFADRAYFDKLQFVWTIGTLSKTLQEKFPSDSLQGSLNEKVSDRYSIHGWIGAVDRPSDLEDNNKISVIARGKLAQEDILSSYNEGGIYASYLIGEIYADFLDLDDERDISTSNRQQYIEDDERYRLLIAHVSALLKEIKNKWTDLRKEHATQRILTDNPAIKEWYDNLKSNTKKYAKKLFSTIETMHFDKGEESKKELLKYGILAFERLKVAEKLDFIENEGIEDIVKYGEIFSDLQDIEATLYWEIANERVKVIRQLAESCDSNAKERVLQKHIFDNLWLLNPAWERATKGSERFEEKVVTEFGNVTASLTDEEKRGRFDIRYRSSAGKHIIIELKRYIPTYKVDIYDLHRQIDKYKSALRKCLRDIGRENEPIEAICIIGDKVLNDMTISEANEKLKGDGRILSYDLVINDSLESYQEYLESQKEVGKLKELIDKI